MFAKVIIASLLLVAVTAAPSGVVFSPSVPVATSSQNIFRISHSAYLAAPAIAAPFVAAPAIAAPLAAPFAAAPAIAAPFAAAPAFAAPLTAYSGYPYVI